MLKVFCILLCLEIIIFGNNLSYGQYCSSRQDTYQAYNIGRDMFVGQRGITIWNYNIDVRQVSDQKLTIEDIYGENTFEWVDTAFCFNFGKCSKLEDDSYCEAIDKARNLVIAIGQKKQEIGSRKYGYLAFRKDKDGVLHKLNDSDVLVWDLHNSGTVIGDFWVSLPGDFYYESSVFVVSRNELYVSVYDTSSSSDNKYHLMSRKLQNNGQWNEWSEVAKIGFRGMFDIEGRIFGMDKKNNVYEFIWNGLQGNVSFNKISNIKELLNCYSNSSLLFVTVTPPKFSKIPTDVTESTKQTSTEGFITTETTTESTTKEIITTTQNQTTQQILFAEETKQEDKQVIWTYVSVVAVIALIIMIALVIILIYRKISKSQSIYLNPNSSKNKVPSATSIKPLRSKLN